MISVILLADRSFGASARNHSGSRTEDVLLGLTVVALVAVGVWAVLRILAMRERRAYNHPKRLFRDLCRAHGLTWSQRRLLRQLARGQQLDDPARLFLEAERFDEPRLRTLRSAAASQARAIHDILFATPSRPESLEPTQTPAVNAPSENAPPEIPPASQPPTAPQVKSPAKPRVEASPIGLFPTPVVPTLDIPPWTTAVVEDRG